MWCKFYQNCPYVFLPSLCNVYWVSVTALFTCKKFFLQKKMKLLFPWCFCINSVNFFTELLKGYSSLYANYDSLCNMKSLFELKLSVLYLSNVNVNAICGYTLLTSLQSSSTIADDIEWPLESRCSSCFFFKQLKLWHCQFTRQEFLHWQKRKIWTSSRLLYVYEFQCVKTHGEIYFRKLYWV